MGYCSSAWPPSRRPVSNGAMMQMFNHARSRRCSSSSSRPLTTAPTPARSTSSARGDADADLRRLLRLRLHGLARLPGLSGFIARRRLPRRVPVYKVTRARRERRHLHRPPTPVGHAARAARQVNDALWKDKSIFPDLSLREGLTLLPLAVIVLVLASTRCRSRPHRPGLHDLLTHVTGTPRRRARGPVEAPMGVQSLDNVASLRFFLPEAVLTVAVLLLVTVDLLAKRPDRNRAASSRSAACSSPSCSPSSPSTGTARGLFAASSQGSVRRLLQAAVPRDGLVIAVAALRTKDAIEYRPNADQDRESGEFSPCSCRRFIGMSMMARSTDL